MIVAMKETFSVPRGTLASVSIRTGLTASPRVRMKIPHSMATWFFAAVFHPTLITFRRVSSLAGSGIPTTCTTFRKIRTITREDPAVAVSDPTDNWATMNFTRERIRDTVIVCIGSSTNSGTRFRGTSRLVWGSRQRQNTRLASSSGMTRLTSRTLVLTIESRV